MPSSTVWVSGSLTVLGLADELQREYAVPEGAVKLMEEVLELPFNAAVTMAA
jgi:hypothetical protein